MNIWYWISEYGKVFCGYLFLMFLWPSVVFHGYLRTKSKTYRFSFCVTAAVIIINTVVLMLGLIHVLNQYLVRLIFYGVFVFALLKNIVACLDRRYRRLVDAKFQDVRTLKDKYRKLVLFILFFIVCYRYVKKAVRFLSFDYLKKIKSCNWQKIRVRVKECIWDFGYKINCLFWKYGMLMIVIVYGMVYFSYGAFQIFSYGSGDLYVHHEWIYGLIKGTVFKGGVYPEAMHCFIYCMHTLFGIKVHSILLYLQGIHVAVLLLAFYLLFREIFHWRYTPEFVLTLFLTLDLKNAEQIRSMFRLQITLPQEFGLYASCICALYLLNYLNKNHTDDRKGKTLKYYWSEDILLFMLALAVIIATHFHVLLMTFIICVPFALSALKKVFDRKYFFPLALSVICAFLIAAAPVAGALAQGIPFNASINWAVNAMGGEAGRTYRQQDEINAAPETMSGFIQKIADNESTITGRIVNILMQVYREGYVMLYGTGRARVIVALTVILILFIRILKWNSSFRYMYEICTEYFPVILASVFYVAVYAAPMMGLPDIIPEGRFFTLGHMMVLAVVMMPVDIFFSGIMCCGRDVVLQVLSLAAAGGIYAGTIAFGAFRGFLFYELSRYNSAAEVTEKIINTFPEYSYTIVSPTDELYPVIEYGWHEELSTFVEKINGEEYTLPSQYVFIYVEKKPVSYAQSYFFEGPSLLGSEKYFSIFSAYSDIVTTQAPQIVSSQISQEDAQKETEIESNSWQAYLQIDKRTILESKAYDWCQCFAREHPSVLNVYYEDDEFVCYYFRQEAGKLPYELGKQTEP